MYRITQEMLHKMTQKRLEQLAHMLTRNLTELYPKRMRTIGKEKTFAFALSCAQESYALGCTNYGELKAYSFVALQLGVGFASDPLYPFVHDILKTEDIFALKMEKIMQHTLTKLYAGDVASLQDYHTALTKLLHVDLAQVKTFTTYGEIVSVLEQVYPQRVKALGGTAHVYDAIKTSTHTKPEAYNIHHPIGVFVYASLVFFLGHSIDRDPLYAWVGKYLNDPEPRMPHKLDRLVKVIRKRVKNNIRYIDKTVKECTV